MIDLPGVTLAELVVLEKVRARDLVNDDPTPALRALESKRLVYGPDTHWTLKDCGGFNITARGLLVLERGEWLRDLFFPGETFASVGTRYVRLVD